MKHFTLSSLLLASLIMVSGCDQSTSESSPFELAVTSYNAQNYPESLLLLKRAIQAEPEAKEVRKLMAQVLIKLGDPVEAERHINKALELGVAKNELMVLLGISLIKQKKYEEVLKNIKFEGNLLNIDSKAHAEVYALRGQALLAEKSFELSLAKFKQSIALDDKCSRAYIGLAGLAFAKENVEQAKQYLQTAFEINPKDVDAWLFKGDMERVQGELKKSVVSYTQAIDNSSPIGIVNQYARLYRAMALAYQQDYNAAWADIKQVKNISGNNVYVDYVSGLIAFQQEDYPTAQGAFEKVLSRVPDHALAHYLLGASHYLQGASEQARNHLVYFLNDNPEHEMAQKMLAMVELNLGDNKAAQQRLAYLLESNPGDSSTLNLLGQYHIKQGNFEEGASYLERSIEKNPDSYPVQLRYGISQLELGEYDIAEKALEKAMGLSQNRQVVEFYRLMSYLKQTQPQKAVNYADELLRANAKNIVASNFKAVALLALKKPEAAQAQFEHSLSVDAGDPTARFNLANQLFAAGNKAGAQKHLLAVVKHHPKLIRGYLKLAQFAMSQQDIQSAETWLQKSLKVEPNNIQASLALSKLKMTQKKTADALNVLSKLNGKAQSHPGVLLAFAEIYTQNTQYSLAQQTLNQFENSFPKLKYSEEYLSLRALLFSKERQYDKAASLYQQLLNTHASSRWAIDLASNQWAADDRVAAIQTLKTWVNKHPKDSLVQIALANYYLVKNDNGNALLAFERANQIVPNHPLVLNNLAWLLKDTDVEKAYKLAQQAVKLSPDLKGAQHTLKVIEEKRGVVQ
jgi:putative PEP-CTERM system TPR-repeat lipoprotein